MINVTDRAAQQLEQLLATQGASDNEGVKLVPDNSGNIGMTVAPPAEGDDVVRRGDTEAPLLIVSAPITAVLDGATLDVQHAPADGAQAPRFTLTPPGGSGVA